MLQGARRALCGGCRRRLFSSESAAFSGGLRTACRKVDAKVDAEEQTAASPSPVAHSGSLGARRDLTLVEAEHDAFAAEFEDAFQGVDERGVASLRPAAKVTVQSKAFHRALQKPNHEETRRLGKPRFNVKDLKADEPLYQPSLWQQLLEQERNRRDGERARLAKASLRRLKQQAELSSLKEAASEKKSSRRLAFASSPSGICPPLPDSAASALGCETKPQSEGVSSSLSEGQGPDEAAKTLEELQSEWGSEAAILGVGRQGEKTPKREDFAGTPEALDEKLGEEAALAESMLFQQDLPTAPAPSPPDSAQVVVSPAEPSAVASHLAKMPGDLWQRLAPHHLQLQQGLIRTKDSGQVLDLLAAAFEAVGGDGGGKRDPSETATGASGEECGWSEEVSLRFGMDPINAVTALHRLARVATPFQREQLLADGRFVKLLEAAEASLPWVDAQGVSNLLWAKTRLELSLSWRRRLLQRCTSLTPEMSAHQLATGLFCLSRRQMPSLPEAKTLEDALVEAVEKRVAEIVRPLDLTCVCAGLAKLRVRRPPLFAALTARARLLLPELSMAELASVAWALAASGSKDAAFFSQVLRRVEQEADQCSSGDVVQLAWALERSGQATEDFFTLTLNPLVRGFMPEFNARQLATLAATYAKAGEEKAAGCCC